MTKQWAFFALCCALGVAVVGCGDDDGTPSTDGGTDGMIIIDGGGDSGRDGGRVDAGTDSGPVGCTVGVGCDPDRGCARGECVPQFDQTIGGTADPIEGFSGGSIPVTYFEGGYCATVGLRQVGMDPMACDPDATENVCGEGCAECAFITSTLTMCLRTCTPSATESTCPGMGQYCDYIGKLCYPFGCQSDDECRIYRPDTNMNGEIDPYDMMMNPMGDRLQYDPRMDIVCNMTTNRCEHAGTMGVSAGAACSRDAECEANGDCIGGWPGGYCSKFGCDVAGRSCAGDGVCFSRRIGEGVFICMQPCTFTGEAMMDTLRIGPMGHGLECREGYSCVWDGVSAAGMPNSGACIPGNYNAVTEPNIGAACTDDDTCYSPFGQGLCLSGGIWAPGYCTILDCAAPGMPTDVCGPNAQCLDLFTDVEGTCFKNCAMAEECSPGDACLDLDGPDMPSTPVCFPVCAANENCRAGEVCDIPAGEMTGTCRAM